MYYVYILKSLSNKKKLYIGYTENLKRRLTEHNSTLNKYNYSSRHKPWELICYLAFKTKDTAEDFERYLKEGSGFAFMKKHLLDKGAT
ncbi:MAG TPA: excinuclease ABC subunit C [Elusimicrobia bacterium]|jgi:predicted GIY-YIG superfamily endonuclease|nr:excinuclease ABC subunit C [Elusimicrobiota bacterium]